MKPKQTISDHIWQFFCSVQLTVYTLVLLASTSIVGTLIIQGASRQEYIQRYGETAANLIAIFDINDMYHAWWYLALLVILCINIVVCSVERLSVTWKIIFPKKVEIHTERYDKKKPLFSFSSDKRADELTESCVRILTRHIGKVQRQAGDSGTFFYAERGRWTRFGVYIVHSSILLLLVGALIGVVFGFNRGSLRLDEGQVSDRVILTGRNAALKLDFAVRCNEFEVKFYETGAPEDYRSNLTVVENGKDVLTEDIRVNHPLRYRGINFFQASYGTSWPEAAHLEVLDAGGKLLAEKTLKIGDEFTLADGTIFRLDNFRPHYNFRGHDLGESFIATITPKDADPFEIGLPARFPTFDKMRKGRLSFVVKGLDRKYYTVLQVTKDPGVPVVYAGFILMILGCWVTFFMSHQTCMIRITPESDNFFNISIFGTTNRNKQGYRFKVEKMLTQIKDV